MNRPVENAARTVLALAILALAIAAVAAFPAGASPTGYTGRTATNSGGCGSCHTTLSGTTTVVLSGPTSLSPGATGSYTCVVTHDPAFSGTNHAGIDIAVKTVPNGSTDAGTLAASGADLKKSGNELTHPSAKTMSGAPSTTSYAFTWTAPAAAGTYAMQAIAIVTNGSKPGTWGWATPLSVNVSAPAPAPTWAATWLLPSSARTGGANAFWTTDLVLTNSGAEAATVNLKFLGHDGSGASGPEQTYAIPARATRTFADVLSSAFSLEADWGPILVRSTVATLAVQGQTWTASAAGGTYGQSVPALAPAEMVGTTPKAIAGVRQDSSFRTNLVLANPLATSATVEVTLLLADGTTSTTRTVELGPYGFSQLNVATDLGVTGLSGGSFLLACTTPGASVAAYASVIDATTSDPRSVLAR
jgi:hypothetical protein